LLLADFAVHDGGGPCRWFGFSFSSKAISVSCLDFVYRIRVLSSVASKEVSAPARRDRIGAIVGVRGFRSHLDLLSSGDGECGGRFAGTVIP